MQPIRAHAVFCRIFTAAGAVLSGWAALAGCTGATAPVHEEPLAGEEELSLAKADGAEGALWTYYVITRRDTRRCAAPACGGLWMRRVNQPDTKCADGSWRTECYVATIDWSRAGFSDSDAAGADAAAQALRAVVRGKLLLRDVDGTSAAVFQATESWESPTPNTAGIAPGSADAAVFRTRAATACPSGACADVRGTRLNKGGQSTATYATLGGTLTGVRPALASDDGILVWADLTATSDRKALTARQSWQRRIHSEGESERSAGPTCSASVLATFPKDELRVHIIDVGQGDAIWVQTPWKSARSESLDVLVDTGASGAMPGSSPGGDLVVSYLLGAGLEEGDVLDALVVTHAHDDHFGGVERIAESFGIARYTDPGFSAGSAAFLAARAAARDLVDYQDGHMHVPAATELVPRVFADSDLFGPRVDTTLLWAAVKPLGGNAANPTGPDVNNTSIALGLRYGGRQVLLMGDVETPVEAALIEAHDAGEIDLGASVLKVAHHGSSRASGTEFLARVFPSPRADHWAIISSGRRTFTGSYIPTDATFERLHAAVPDQHVLSTENRDEHKIVGTEHGDDSVLVRVKASGQVSACYVP